MDEVDECIAGEAARLPDEAGDAGKVSSAPDWMDLMKAYEEAVRAAIGALRTACARAKDLQAITVGEDWVAATDIGHRAQSALDVLLGRDER
jgi:hypothetical protein